ncbi:MAG: potassium transporter [Kofleriaceae bacterium]|nr:potassium transporter [Kofleriaceae bacterium]
MTSAHEFLVALTVVLCVAGVTTVVFQRLRQPVVLGYILAGLLIGPHLPLPVVASPDIVHTLSELGVILLMFGLGLEFDLGKLFRAAPTAGVTGLLQCSVMTMLGFVLAQLLGWSTIESLFAGAIIAISSTTIIAKAYDEQGITGDLREFVVAILIVEDLIAVILMAILTGVATGSGLSAHALTIEIGRLVCFLVGLVAIGLLVVPRLMRAIVALGRPETIVVTAVGVCFGITLLVQAFGYSVALGAFVAGVLVAESGKAHQIEQLVQPVRDIFAAVFFVAVGMLIDPTVVLAHWGAIVLFTLVVVVGKVASVSFGAFMTGKGTKTSIAAGMSLAQIGEFSFIIAGLGVSLGAVGNQIYPVAVSVSALTTLLTPALIRRSQSFASFIDDRLPRPLQTFVGLYGSWIDGLRRSRTESRSTLRRYGRTLALDVAMIAALLVATALSFDTLTRLAEDHLGFSHSGARWMVAIVAGVLALPFCIGVLRTSERFARLFGEAAIPHAEKQALDLGRQPRLVVEAAVRLVGVLIAGSALVAVVQPVVPGDLEIVVLLVALAVLAYAFWRRATGLQGHVRAAAQAVIQVLAAQRASATGDAGSHTDPLEQTRELFPGLGAPVTYDLGAESPAIGRSLSELELRSATGATVLALVRGSEGFALPDSHQALQAGDTLALAGTDEAIAAAIALLDGPSGQYR